MDYTKTQTDLDNPIIVKLSPSQHNNFMNNDVKNILPTLNEGQLKKLHNDFFNLYLTTKPWSIIK